MSSNYGMMIDLVSDNVTNLILILVLINKLGIFNWVILVIILKTYLLSIGYGLNEAILSHRTSGSDNFYLKVTKISERKL
jgi:phosphatidylglycerophosphate synthase